MRSCSNNQENSDRKDEQDEDIVRDIESPTMVRTQWLIEPPLLYDHQAERPDSKLNICRSSPNRSNDRKRNPSLDMSAKSHGIVQYDRH